MLFRRQHFSPKSLSCVCFLPLVHPRPAHDESALPLKRATRGHSEGLEGLDARERRRHVHCVSGIKSPVVLFSHWCSELAAYVIYRNTCISRASPTWARRCRRFARPHPRRSHRCICRQRPLPRQSVEARHLFVLDFYLPSMIAIP